VAQADGLTKDEIKDLIAQNEARAEGAKDKEESDRLYAERNQLLDQLKFAAEDSPGAAPEQPTGAPVPAPPQSPQGMTIPQDFMNAVRNGPPQDPNKVHWLGNPDFRPSWTQGMRYSRDAQGNMTVDSPELGETTFAPSGKRLTPVQNGEADNIARSLRAMSYLQQTGGKRIVEGKGSLDETGWKEHIAERKRVLGVEVERNFDNLSEGVRLFHETQTGTALAAAIPAHVLGGRQWDDSQKIVSRARQDIEIARHQMDTARTPEELAEAENHLLFVVGNAEAQFGRYKEDIYAGGENTITGIKIGAAVAVNGAAVATPALLAGGGAITAKAIGGGALAGGAFSTIRQAAEIHDGTRKKFSGSDIATGAATGALLGLAPGAAPLLMGPAVASSADEISQGHLAAGAVDAFGAVAPIGAAKLAQSGTGRAIGQWLRPRAAGIFMRASQGVESVPGLSGRSPTASFPTEVAASPRSAAFEPVAATPAPAAAPIVEAPPSTPAVAATSAPAVALNPPSPPLAGGIAAAAVSNPGFSPAPANSVTAAAQSSAFQFHKVELPGGKQNTPANDRRLPYKFELFEDSAARQSKAEHGTDVVNLGSGAGANRSFPGVDLLSEAELTQVKAYTGPDAGKRVLEALSDLSGSKDFNIPGSKAWKTMEKIEALRAQMAQSGGRLQLPKEYDANRLRYIRQDTVFRVADDLVESIRADLAKELQTPHGAAKYGLSKQLTLEDAETYAARRIKPGGMSEDELK
jgi:hypothetical protein